MASTRGPLWSFACTTRAQFAAVLRPFFSLDYSRLFPVNITAESNGVFFFSPDPITSARPLVLPLAKNLLRDRRNCFRCWLDLSAICRICKQDKLQTRCAGGCEKNALLRALSGTLGVLKGLRITFRARECFQASRTRGFPDDERTLLPPSKTPHQSGSFSFRPQILHFGHERSAEPESRSRRRVGICTGRLPSSNILIL